MAKIVVWSPAEASSILQQRLREAKEARRERETQWRLCEKTVYGKNGLQGSGDVNINIQELGLVQDSSDTPDWVNINYSFKNLRYIHSQLSANPPSVIPRPASNDSEDRRSADAADRVLRYGLKQYAMQEKVDRSSLNGLLYGTGFLKTIWNPDAGEILDVNEETGELQMEGDFELSVPSVWNVFLDPDAECWDEVRFVFERLLIPWEEALYRWPDKKEILAQVRVTSRDRGNDSYDSALVKKKYDVVELYEYWEKGCASNGMMGRYGLCTANGQLVHGILPSPERYASGKNVSVKRGVLPYHILTDIDIPATVYGKSVVEYEAPIQDYLNKLDTITLESVQAHGVPRLILPEGSEIAEGSITDQSWDIVRITGTQPPHYMQPMPTPSIVPELLSRYKNGIDDMAGVNDAMFGKQSREQSGFSMQYSTNQGNMIRTRLLNKYRDMVESLYRRFLLIAQNNWDVPRTVKVLGKEKAFEVSDIKGSDLDGGYDLVAEYGASLSLDPTSRREEMMTLMPLFEKAGVESRTMLKMMKLNELSNAYDVLDLATDRQREIFEEMIASGRYIHPEELQDHKNMLSFAYSYVMTSEFKYLEEKSQTLIRQHIKDREKMAAAPVGDTTLVGTPGPAPAPTPADLMGGLPPLPAGPGAPVV